MGKRRGLPEVEGTTTLRWPPLEPGETPEMREQRIHEAFVPLIEALARKQALMDHAAGINRTEEELTALLQSDGSLLNAAMSREEALSIRVSSSRKPKDPRELAARALCRLHGLPEDATLEGQPMWMSYLDEVNAVLKAIGWKQETRKNGDLPEMD